MVSRPIPDAVHLRFIGKLLVDFVLVIMELFRQVLRLRCYERISFGSRRFAGGGQVFFTKKVQVEGDIPHQQFVHG